ncbi:MAG: glycosyl hydrolase [Burkholderiaceae bacterium]|nr:glycosyl hydrolase [Burkholderiaceae bacterium]
MRINELALLLAAMLIAVPSHAAGADVQEQLKRVQPRPATIAPEATTAMILGMAKAGERIVAVGEQGVVLLRDAPDAPLRQAKAVPVDATLTAVDFVDAKRGWAVGQWGVILATTDGGETWQRQRIDLDTDRPLFAVHFLDAEHGVAVGLWSLVLTTEDGGKTWVERTMQPPPDSKRADLNLLGLFADAHGVLYATGERGMVLKSVDQGATWAYLPTGYKGSFWTGIAQGDGSLLVGGQRGSIYRSDDGGAHWTAVESGGKHSITAFARQGANIVAVGLEGFVAFSTDNGGSFKAQARGDRLALTAAVADGKGRWLFGSRAGLVAEPAR